LIKKGLNIEFIETNNERTRRYN